jgi:Dynamin family
MHSSIVTSLDTLAAWREGLAGEVAALSRFVADHGLADAGEQAAISALRTRLLADKLVLAFVAEFSRGKSELINAIFFADAGRRMLPATPGRTTMCPVELFSDAGAPPRLSLLPIETRLAGLALAELRGRDDAWSHRPLPQGDPEALAEALMAVTQTRRVSVELARQLGFWSDADGADNPPQDGDGSVEVPAWRHALINHRHPLLQRGLVVIDTPGLNAIGAEPELTLGLLPQAHATVFVLAADTGVTRSDLSIWRDCLAGRAIERFVVLNKIDALADPLLKPAEVDAQIERQCEQTAATLDVPPWRVFPLSARNALAARVAGNDHALQASRLPALEAALGGELLPRQRELLRQAASAAAEQLRSSASRRLSERRRQNAEQMLELRGLRGKSGAKVRLMLQRLAAESADFERCTARLAALGAVHARLLRTVLALLSSDALRAEVATMQASIGGGPLRLGARKAFDALCQRLRITLQQAAAQADEMRLMLDGSFQQLNTEFGFAYVLGSPPRLNGHLEDLDLIAQNYSRYLSMTQAWRLAVPGFAEQFRRMLVARLRVVFESAAGDIELWSKAASAQIETQLRERRRGYKKREEALQRIQSAAGDLEQRIGEVEATDQRLGALQQDLDRAAAQVSAFARGVPATTGRAETAERDAA